MATVSQGSSQILACISRASGEQTISSHSFRKTGSRILLKSSLHSTHLHNLFFKGHLFTFYIGCKTHFSMWKNALEVASRGPFRGLSGWWPFQEGHRRVNSSRCILHDSSLALVLLCYSLFSPRLSHIPKWSNKSECENESPKHMFSFKHIWGHAFKWMAFPEWFCYGNFIGICSWPIKGFSKCSYVSLYLFMTMCFILHVWIQTPVWQFWSTLMDRALWLFLQSLNNLSTRKPYSE